jgi:hypothetical protein
VGRFLKADLLDLTDMNIGEYVLYYVAPGNNQFPDVLDVTAVLESYSWSSESYGSAGPFGIVYYISNGNR